MNRQRAETILQLNPRWTIQDIRKAYKKRAKQLHPDKNGIATKFIELKEAHDYLIEIATKDDSWQTSASREAREAREHKEFIELLTKLINSYQSALIPLILSLPPKKQRWIIDFLELYGELLLGQDAHDILKELYLHQEHQEVPISYEKYCVYFHEMLMDRIIVEETDTTYEWIPSWMPEYQGHTIIRKLPEHITIDASTNHIYFHAYFSIRDLFQSSEETIFINRSYFSGDAMIHVIGSIQREQLRLRNTPQIIHEKVFQYRVYSKNGEELLDRQGDEGIFMPTESVDDPVQRGGCSWCIHLM